MIKAVVFDFYGVFTPDVYDAWLEENRLIREGTYARLSEKLDAGLISRQEFFSSLSNQSNIAAQSIQEYFSIQKDINPSIIKILKRLNTSGLLIGLLSNGSNSVRDLLEKTGITQLFSQITLSSEVGMIKPNPEIFKYSFTQLHIQPKDVLYIDDRIANTVIAKSLGATVITFVSVDLLETELKALNLL